MDFFRLSEKKTLTIERVIKILEGDNSPIDTETATDIHALIYALSNLSVKVEIRIAASNKLSKGKVNI